MLYKDNSEFNLWSDKLKKTMRNCFLFTFSKSSMAFCSLSCRLGYYRGSLICPTYASLPAYIKRI